MKIMPDNNGIISHFHSLWGKNTLLGQTTAVIFFIKTSVLISIDRKKSAIHKVEKS